MSEEQTSSDEPDAVTAIYMVPGKEPEVLRDFVASVDAMQAKVDGYYEFVHSVDPDVVAGLCDALGVDDLRTSRPNRFLVLAVNETGRLDDLPLNDVASELYAGRDWSKHGPGANIRGPALLLEVD